MPKYFYVVTYRPPYPEKGVKTVVYAEKDYSIDCCPATLTAIFQVGSCTTKQEAIAVALEYAAGYKNLDVRLIIGKSK